MKLTRRFLSRDAKLTSWRFATLLLSAVQGCRICGTLGAPHSAARGSEE